MVKLLRYLFCFIFLFGQSFAETKNIYGQWLPLKDVSIIEVSTDLDNGDGPNDGAIKVKSNESNAVDSGVAYKLDASFRKGTKLNIQTVVYKTSSSFVRVEVSLYNLTDNVTLQTAEPIYITTHDTSSFTRHLKYTIKESDVGDNLELRYLRKDDGNPVRTFSIDYTLVSANSDFVAMNLSKWDVLGNVEFDTRYTLDDEDNGDGPSDGAIVFKSLEETASAKAQGLTYHLGKAVQVNQSFNVETVVYNHRSSYVKFVVQLYNRNDERVLVESALYHIQGSDSVPRRIQLDYNIQNVDLGDDILLRFLRQDDGHPARAFSVDLIKLNQQLLNTSLGSWRAIGDVNLENISNENNREVLLVDGKSQVIGQGVSYLITEPLSLGDKLSIEAIVYNPRSSYIDLHITLFNETDNRVLVDSAPFRIQGSDREPRMKRFFYTLSENDLNDQLSIRFLREDNGHIARDFVIDSISLSSNREQLEMQPSLWTPIGSEALLTTQFDDADNGDGQADGSLQLSNNVFATGLGVSYILNKSMPVGENVSIKTVVYNPRSSFVRFQVLLYNKTEERELASSRIYHLVNQDYPAVSVELNYTTLQSDSGDQLELRFLRKDPDGHSARAFSIDFVEVNRDILTNQFSRWQPLGDVQLSQIYSDGNNGDGSNDGALYVKGNSVANGLGVDYYVKKNYSANDLLTFKTVIFNSDSSYVKLRVQLYNKTESIVLTQTDLLTLQGLDTTPLELELSYTISVNDLGDDVVLRFKRFDDGLSARRFAIDFVSIKNNSEHHIASSDVNMWLPIGPVNLTKVFDDEDNGDGAGDGSVHVQASEYFLGAGAAYPISFSPELGRALEIETSFYNPRSSYVDVAVQLYNANDNLVLAETETIRRAGFDTTPVNFKLYYIIKNSDLNDNLQVRFLRKDDGNKARAFSVDFLKIFYHEVLSQDFYNPAISIPVPDLPLMSADSVEKAQIDRIAREIREMILGTNGPSAAELNNAISDYENLNIVVTNGKISGKELPLKESWAEARFLSVFARHLYFNPGDQAVREMVSNTVWFFTQMYYEYKIPTDGILYFYKLFSKPVIFLKQFLNQEIQDLFEYSFYRHMNHYRFVWSPVYTLGDGPQGTINMDEVGNMGDALLAFSVVWQKGYDEKLRWVKGTKRYLERFMSYSPGTSDGIKVDGSGFHHFSALNNYTYNYNTPMQLLGVLQGSPFQVSIDAYKVLRKGVYTQYFISNDNVEALSMSGRHPEARRLAPKKDIFKTFVKTGGKILGLETGDPLLAGAYIRHFGESEDFQGLSEESLQGFTQMNHHTSGVYWKDNWMAVARGATNWGFGAEIFVRSNANIYGRYQSYGSLDIIYPGGEVAGNGYFYNGFNWNYHPGTTSIVLPWNKLRAEKDSQKEYQQKGFAGSLAFKNNNHPILDKTSGEYGIFAIDFQEAEEGHGRGEALIPLGHNPSFKFKKSKFFLGDIIVSLGSNISNDDQNNPTVTTLYQRGVGGSGSVQANGNTYQNYHNLELDPNVHRWILDNYGTGFYIPNGNNVVISRTNEVIPYHSQYESSDWSANPPSDNFIGHIDHGVNPSNAEYEYVVTPQTNALAARNFKETMRLNPTSIYSVISKNADGHIIHYTPDNIWGLALFNPRSLINNGSIIKANSHPCLIMYQESSQNANSVTLSLSNPLLNLTPKQFDNAPEQPIQITLHGSWSLMDSHPKVSVIEDGGNYTVLEFKTSVGLPLEIVVNRN